MRDLPPRSTRHDDPEVPETVTGSELDRDVRRDLSGLAPDNATAVARHLVMAGELLDTDPAAALAHARAAQRRAGRVAVVRETTGLAAYRAGHFDEALRELRTARRLSGSQDQLPVMADCERGLGRPERALEAAVSPEARNLDRAAQIELAIVVSGARQDLGEMDAAVVALQLPELTGPVPPALRDSARRLQEAYDAALVAAGRAPARDAGGAGSAEVQTDEEDDDVVLWDEEMPEDAR